MNSSESHFDPTPVAGRKIRHAIISGLCILILAPVTALAQTERQHGVHVHGEAKGSLALDGAQLRLELEIPGINLAGFERSPRGPEENATIERVVATLNGGNWLTVDDRGNCTIESINAHTHGFDPADHDHDDDGHDGHDHHGHSQNHHSQNENSHDHSADGHDHRNAKHSRHGHAEFHVVAQLECADAARLRWLEIDLFDEFPGNELIVVDVLTDTLATRARLGPARQRIDRTTP